MGIYNSDNASHCAASFLILFRRLKPHHHCKLTNLPPSFSLLSSRPPQLIFLTVKMDLSPRKTGEIVLRKKSTFSTTLFCLMKTDQPHLLSFPPLPSLLFVTSFLPPAIDFISTSPIVFFLPLLYFSPLLSYFYFRRRERKRIFLPSHFITSAFARRRPFCTINPTPPTARRRRQFSTWRRRRRDQVSFAYRSVFIHSEKKHRTGERGKGTVEEETKAERKKCRK